MTSADRAVAGETNWWRDELAAALLDARGVVPEQDVVWEQFHRRLAARAALRLARLRAGGGLTRWSRVTDTASLAAATVFTVVIRRFRDRAAHRSISPSNSR